MGAGEGNAYGLTDAAPQPQPRPETPKRKELKRSILELHELEQAEARLAEKARKEGGAEK
jgi:hypothetical protein